MRTNDPGAVTIGSPGRRASLDIARGIAIAGVILLNTAGGFPAVYQPLRHARSGWAFADLGFPALVFIKL